MQGGGGEEGEGDGGGEVGGGEAFEKAGDEGGVETEEELVGVQPVKLIVIVNLIVIIDTIDPLCYMDNGATCAPLLRRGSSPPQCLKPQPKTLPEGRSGPRVGAGRTL